MPNINPIPVQEKGRVSTTGVTPWVFIICTGVMVDSGGVTVLMRLNAKPRRPSPDPEEKAEETSVAHSTAWLLITRPPKVTVS